MAILILCSKCAAILKLTDAKNGQQILERAEENGWVSATHGWICPEHAPPGRPPQNPTDSNSQSA